jgi:hypothetical protein
MKPEAGKRSGHERIVLLVMAYFMLLSLTGKTEYHLG